MRDAIGRWCWLVLLFLLNGCVAVSISSKLIQSGCITCYSYDIRSVHASRELQAPVRMFIESNVKTSMDAFVDSGTEFAEGLLDTFLRRLGQCGVTTQLLEPSATLQLDPQEARKEEIAAFAPDALLSFMVVGAADVYADEAAYNPSFDLVLSDAKSGAPLWRSHTLTNSDVALLHIHRAAKGRDLADLLIERIKFDGALRCDQH